MNTIGEIISKKNKIKNESIYETYVRVLCPECENKNNDKDLCKITRTIDNKAKCLNYERCMTNKCDTCKNIKKCFKGGEKENEY